tara:strand:+ start:39107 stop:39694 length:588 start_codon:yes stop_codon:yes gene_type:complete
MQIIAHRINTKKLLEATSINFGVEVDIRSDGKNLIIHHDPMTQGEYFKDWILAYKHGTLILNVKEEGLEEALIKLMDQHSIYDYFFLDQSFPFLRKTALMGETRCAVRVSEYENIETALSLSGMIDWVWVDCFNKFPLSYKDSQRLMDAGFKICFVSPELQGRSDTSHISQFRYDIELLGIEGDAICTKYPDLWV